MNGDNTTTGSIRVLSLRLDDGLRAQLEVLAQIQQRSLTDECRLGLEAWIETSRADPTVLARAEQVRVEIETEAETRRGAIAMVLGDKPAPDRRTTKQA